MIYSLKRKNRNRSPATAGILSLIVPLLLASAKAFQVSPPSRNRISPPSGSSTSRRFTEKDSGALSFDGSIEDRVREMLQTDAKFIKKELETGFDATTISPLTKPPAKKAPTALPNVYTVQTVQDYNKIVGDADGKLTIARFSASWCLACKAIAPLFNRLASESPHITFVNFVVTKENRQSVRDLGVPSLPYGYIIHPSAGVVEELSLNKRHFNDFLNVVQSYDDAECTLPTAVDDDSGIYESPYARAA